MIETVTRPHRSRLVQWAAERPEVLVLSADLTASCEADGFRDAYPQRFFSLGMAEQNMMGFAAGLAREGFRPFVHTFAVFITRRPFDQVAMAIGYPNLPVRLIGFLPGITTAGGVTHQAIDDIGLMRLIPNLRVLETGDATEVESVLEVADAVDGPVYVRQLRGEVPRLFPTTAPMRFGTARPLGEGRDVCVLSSGICTEEALRATTALRAQGVPIRHLHCSTLKPFDDPQVSDALAHCRHGVVTMENHSIIGGLGAAVAELMAEQGIGRRLIRLGLRDRYAHGASRAYLLREYGLDAMALVRAVETLIGEPLDLAEEDLAAVRSATVPEAEKTEAL
jgi:transketolase